MILSSMLIRKDLIVNSWAVLCARLIGKLQWSLVAIIRTGIGLIHYSLLTAKCIDLSLLIDYNTYFKDVTQYFYCQFRPVSG